MAANRYPGFSADQINWASEIFLSSEPSADDWSRAVECVAQWRAAHEPLLLQMEGLITRRAKTLNPHCLIPSRLKRLRTIIDKCSRLPRHVKLWDMQDVGGLRIIVDDQDEVSNLEQLLELDPPPSFKFEWRNDYIGEPKRTGYRSLHRIYSFVADDEQYASLNGLKIEVQIRSRLQHAWATANEIVGTVRREDLKSNRGNVDWLRYFALTGSIMALIEGTPVAKNVPADPGLLREEFDALEKRLDAFERITAYSVTPNFATSERLGPIAGRGYMVIKLGLRQRKLDIMVYGPHQFEIAEADYRKAEKEHIGNSDVDILFLHLENVALLQRAYPNYFLDAGEFLHAVYPDWQTRAV